MSLLLLVDIKIVLPALYAVIMKNVGFGEQRVRRSAGGSVAATGG